MDVHWERYQDDLDLPWFVLTPSDPHACPVAISATGTWNNFDFGPWDAGSTFEPWGKHEPERLELLRRCLGAVLDGRFEIELRARTYRTLFRRRRRTSWTIVGRFVGVSDRPYTRFPADPEDFRFAFGDEVIEVATEPRILGPQLFAPYR